MKYLFVLLSLTLMIIEFGKAQSVADTVNNNPNYDKALAEKLKGDDYGMKRYFFVIMKSGTNTSTDRDLINASFRGHFKKYG